MSSVPGVSRKRPLVCLLVALSQLALLVPLGAGDSRLATFSDGSREGEAIFGPGGGNLTPLSIDIPGDAYLFNASVTLEGLPSVLSGGSTATTDPDFLALDGRRNVTIGNDEVRLSSASSDWSQSTDGEFRAGRAENVDIFHGVSLAKGAKYSIVVENKTASPFYASQLNPASAVNSVGNVILAWEDLRSGTSLDIYVRIFDPAGAPLTDTIPVCEASGHQVNPALALDSSDNIFILWQDARAGDSDIYGRKLTSSGAPAGSEFSVCNAADDQCRPAVCAASSGKMLAAWDDFRTSKHYAVRTQMLNPDGTPDGSENIISSFPTDQTAPAICPATNGFVLAYQNSSNLTGADIEGALLDTAGAFASSFPVCNAAHNQSSVVMAAGPGGKFCVAWEDRRGGADFDIHARRFDPSGAFSGGEVAVVFAAGDQRNPSLAVRSNGDVLVAWEDERSGSADVYFKRFDASWNPVGTEVAASAEKRDQDSPAVAFDAGGSFFVAWADWRDGLPNVRLQKYGNPRFVYTSGGLVSSRILSPASTFGSVGLCITLPRVARAATDTTGFRLDILDGYEDVILQSGLLPGHHINVNPREHPFIRLSIRMWTLDENITPVLRRWSVGTAVSDDLDIPNGGAHSSTRQTGGGVVLDREPALLTLTNDVAVKGGTTNSYQVQVAKFQDGTESYVAVWQEGAGSAASILARKFGRDGAPQTPELTVCDAPGQQETPSVAVDLNGQIVVVWADNRTGKGFDVYGRRFDSGGGAQGSEFLVCGTAADEKTPRVTTDLENNFIVVWVDYSKVYMLLYMRKYGPDGTPKGLPVEVSVTQFSLMEPVIATDSQNRIILAWSDFRNGNYDIYATIFRPDCTPLTINGEIKVCVKTGEQWSAAISVDHDDNFLVAWEDTANIAGNDIFAKKFNSTGAPISGEISIVASAFDQGDPAIAFDSSGNFFAAWHTYGDAFDIKGRYFDGAGNPLGAELMICNVKNVEGEPADQLHAVMACGPKDEFIVAWVDNRPKYDMDCWAKSYGFPRHLTSGTYLTPAYDLGHAPLSLDLASWNASMPNGSAITASLRSGPDRARWTSWEAVSQEDDTLSTPPDRYVQWQFSLSTPVPADTPVLEDLFLGYTTWATNGTLVSPPLGVPVRITELVVDWNATLNGERIDVEVSQDNGSTWAGCGRGLPVEPDPKAESPVLRYRVFLHSNGTATPVLEDISCYYAATGYPTDPALDVGGDGTDEWSFDGIFNATVTIGGLEGPLNTILDRRGNLPGNVRIPLQLRSASAGIIRLSGLSIIYNSPPVITVVTPLQDNLTIDEGESVDFSVGLHDSDGDDLTILWTVDGRPAQNGLPDFHFRTDHSSNGSYEVKLNVADSYWSVNRTWHLTVQDVNRLPVLDWSPERDVTINETEKVSFWAVVSDPDGDGVGVNWSLDGVRVSTQLSWEYVTDHNSSGTHYVSVSAFDGRGASVHNWTVAVTNKNRAPLVLSAIPAPAGVLKSVKNKPVTFVVDMFDPDADLLSYRWKINGLAVPGEANSSFICRKGLAAGQNTVTVEVSDGESTVLQSWELSVALAPEDEVTAGPVPGMALVAALVILLIIGLAAIFMMRKSRGVS